MLAFISISRQETDCYEIVARRGCRLALATTLRFFVQDRDGISLEQIARLYQVLPVQERAKDSARHAVESLIRFLNAPTQLACNGQPITDRTIFEVFMYGSIAHANKDKKTIYDAWMQMPAVAGLVVFMFEGIIARMIRVILSFRAMNERTIQVLQQQVSPGNGSDAAVDG